MAPRDWRTKGRYVERLVGQRYAADGWEVVPDGRPDFLMIKRDDKGTIAEVAFVEVKNRERRGLKQMLQPNQMIWADALLSLGLDYRIETGRRGRAFVLARKTSGDMALYFHPLRMTVKPDRGRVPETLESEWELAPPIKRHPSLRVSKRVSGTG